jgi:hypothetical protein
MKAVSMLSIAAIFLSCNAGQKLIVKQTEDGRILSARKNYFSGIDYIYIESKLKGKLKYYLYYDCECGVDNKISIRKGVLSGIGSRSLWAGVTDTAEDIKLFNEPVASNRLISPIEFMPITQEEISILEEGLRRVDKECCKIPDKPVSRIIGYVRVKTNE